MVVPVHVRRRCRVTYIAAIVIKPDFPECITDFEMLRFEDETTVSAASSWVLEATTAEALVVEKESAAQRSGN